MRLALSNGVVFSGDSFASEETVTGEVIFNTSMSGYQEILTDPSYAGQIITFSYPHIGNVGFNEEDFESDKVWVRGVIAKEFSRCVSNYRSKGSILDLLSNYKISGLQAIDTRSLVVALRETGSLMGVLSGESARSDSDLVEQAKSLPTMEGQNLVSEVSCAAPYDWTQGVWSLSSGYSEIENSSGPLVVVIDCGVKRNILRLLVSNGFRVKVVPASTSADEINALSPDALFVSNGPGDPEPVLDVRETVKQFIGKLPMFGICLGHQIIGLAMDVPTVKLKFGHHAANHPIQSKDGGKVIISSQNHGFAASESDYASEINLNDKTVAAFDIPDMKCFSVQYHPEASPGPHDGAFLFSKFRSMVEKNA